MTISTTDIDAIHAMIALERENALRGALTGNRRALAESADRLAKIERDVFPRVTISAAMPERASQIGRA
ncbi:hypothetical protein Q4543_17745 [Salipiger sp. 1_MG-2023]|uniref:hypothetical protein n=1 Tax=Salipiger sp. 1_MG-2023 TaxID=3062665 RepID=UPI0026E20BC5|nr:hypothetical protein [Salipiger sp. 1_MG-2023]MDO6587359.1 hypothetical protein [Salipiger sp. 1_MG-2023]